MKKNITAKTIISERLRRQCISNPLKSPEDYVELFRLLQPVSTMYFSAPGSPPRLVHRTTFDDGALADEMRERRGIVKGRFHGGTIGYVFAEDLELYANVFRRPLSVLNEVQQKVFDAIKGSETLTPRQIKAETGLLNKHIMPALHRLQESFIVYEDQVTSDWERNWYEFASEWPEVNLDPERWETDAVKVFLNFLKGHVFATLEQLKDWSLLPSKPLVNLIQNMEKKKMIIPQVVNGLGEGWICPEDVSLEESDIPVSVFMLHKSDILARAHNSELKRRFGHREVLQYLMIDGIFSGAVIGHWRIGPHDVDDIIIELPARERIERREEILKAVAWQYRPPHHRILRYDGSEVDL